MGHPGRWGRLHYLYQAHADWVAATLSTGFELALKGGVPIRFPGYRRPFDLHAAVAATFEAYLGRLDAAVPSPEADLDGCRWALLDCAREVVGEQVVRALRACAAFEWPTRGGALLRPNSFDPCGDAAGPAPVRRA